MNQNKKKPGSRIWSDRTRKNILKNIEYAVLEKMCSVMPPWVFPDLLTAFGVFGAVVVFIGLQMALVNKVYLLICVLGLAIHWFGDSMDGRLAYYRKTPRKWYGWALDLNADWLATIIIGLGFYFYFPSFKIVAFFFVVAYGGAMLLSLIRYQITGKYVIDSGILGPTELRILLATVLVFEIFFDHVLWSFGFFGSILLIIFNTIESYKILKAGDVRDAEERKKKKANPDN